VYARFGAERIQSQQSRAHHRRIGYHQQIGLWSVRGEPPRYAFHQERVATGQYSAAEHHIGRLTAQIEPVEGRAAEQEHLLRLPLDHRRSRRVACSGDLEQHGDQPVEPTARYFTEVQRRSQFRHRCSAEVFQDRLA
jgi:hypothetical protein